MAYLDAVTRLGPGGGPRMQYAGFAAAASAAITGDFTEAQIVAGGEIITITLLNDTWVASGATFNAQRQNIIDGLDSAQSELLGWNNEVRDKEVVTAVVRTSDTVVTITLTASPLYDITADETITVTIPATSLTGAQELTGSPTVSVTADAEVGKQKGGGRGRRIQYVIEVDGEKIPVTSIAEAESILLQVRDLAKESATKDVTTATTPKPPRVTVKTASGNVTTSITLQREVKRTQKVVNQAYIRRAKQISQDIEISNLMLIKIEQEERDDESAIIALLLM